MRKTLIKWLIIILIPVIFIISMIIWARNLENNRKLSKEYADKLVCYPDGDYNNSIIDEMKDRLSHVPAKYLKVLYDNQAFIRTINGPVTSDAEFYTDPMLKQNKTDYEKFTGVFLCKSNSIVISIDKTSSYSIEIHEVGHAVDHILLKDISGLNEFKDIFNKEGAKFFNKAGQEHYLENSSEYFAEVFSYYYSNNDTRKYLKERAPQTYKFIKKLEKRN